MRPTTEPTLGALLDTVVKGDYCIGCGACAAVEHTPLQMIMDAYGKYIPRINSERQQAISKVDFTAICPFAENSLDEEEIGSRLYGETCSADPYIGFFKSVYAGYAIESAFRANGSSGGIGTWIVKELLERKLVDGVIHVRAQHPSLNDRRLFRYQLSTTTSEVLLGSKSRYYPIEMSEVLNTVRQLPGKYVFVGIPCFVKAVRLLMQHDEELNQRITYCVGLVCGHLKTAHYALMLAWQCGVKPPNVQEVDFRAKLPGRKASQYGFQVSGVINGETVSRIKPMSELFGSDWGMGFLKPNACDFCDDVVAETADVSIGDAWLPQYLEDHRGTNVIIVRNAEIDQLLQEAVLQGRLKLDVIDADSVRRSQAGGFRHRRDGLAYRLAVVAERGEWAPLKRISPDKRAINPRLRTIQNMRLLLSKKSHEAFVAALRENDFKVFTQQLDPLAEQYRKLYRQPFWKRVLLKFKGMARSVKR